MNQLLSTIITGLMLFGSVSAWANYSLTVTATGFNGSKGNAMAAVYNNKSGFASDIEDAAMVTTTNIENGNAIFNFENVKPGTYAVFVFHDEDANSEFKTNWIGFPKEGAANSNNHQGIPSFKKSSFEVAGNTDIEVEMWYP
jgi:uncharacterized protein (DUF2141 family)